MYTENTTHSGVCRRKGYMNVQAPKSNTTRDIVSGLLTTALTRDGLENSQQCFLKKKRNDDLRIIKVVNNLLRNSVIITYVISKLNNNKVIDVYFKRYRKNTIEKFGQPCRITVNKRYDLDTMQDCNDFVKDIEEHMRVCPENLKTINEALPLRISGFSEIGTDTLYAMEIYDFHLNTNRAFPLESTIDLSLVSDKFTKDFTINVKDIITYTEISELVGKWLVFNYKGAFKIKDKEDLHQSYNVIVK